MASLLQIHDKLHETFCVDAITDAAYNGIQIAGRDEVTKIAVAVDAGLSTLEQAIALKADMLFVHHGIFWGKALPIVGAHKELVQKFLDSKISLYALHLPLDAHQTHGNSAQLAEFLGLELLEPAAEYSGTFCGVIAHNKKRESLSKIQQNLQKLDGANNNFLSLEFGPDIPERICIVSGAGCEQLYNFEREPFDTLITGEPKQFAYHFSKAQRLNALFPGHYTTETLGVQSVAKLIADEFALPWEYISEPTGI